MGEVVKMPVKGLIIPEYPKDFYTFGQYPEAKLSDKETNQLIKECIDYLATAAKSGSGNEGCIMASAPTYKVTDEHIRESYQPRQELSTGQVVALLATLFVAAAMIGSAVAWVVWPLVEWIF